MTLERFEIDPDPRRAWTLPSSVYRDPAWYERIVERVLVPSWQCVGHDSEVRVPGWVRPRVLLPGCLDEPVLLTRDRDDRLHCLSNVCTHRGNLVAEHEGSVAQLRCRYHGRRFRHDGTFHSMPEFEDVADFPSPSDDLPSLGLERFGPWLFTSLGAAQPFDEWIGPVRERLAWYPFDRLRLDASRSRDYLVEANWILYCDNYLEGFHIPYVHAALAEALDYGQYRTELFAWGNLQLGIASSGQPTFDLPESSPDAGLAVAAYYYWLFPNLMLNVYPWGVSVNIVQPLGLRRTRVSFLAFVGFPERLEEGAGAELDRVEREDEAVVEQVQQGVRSRLYGRGRYSPAREPGVHHFHRLLAGALNDEPAE